MLRPVPVVSPQELAAGQRALVRDLAWANVTGAFSGGVILVAFMLALGATPLQVGLLAAIPALAQVMQLPASALVDRLRLRRRIGVLATLAGRMLILVMAAVAFMRDSELALLLIIGAQVLINALNAIGACAVNSWLHQLIPHRALGRFFARRLFAGTLWACIGTLAAGALIDRAPFDNPMHAYALAFVLASAAGFISAMYLARAPEPEMSVGGPSTGLMRRLMAPFADLRFRRLLVFLGAWTVAANLAAPFLTVYLIRQRGYAVTSVTLLWVASQLANALTIYLWGRLSDRLSNKAVLAVALPAHFAATLALCFVDGVSNPHWQLALLYAIHLLMGVAAGGIGLATGNLGLKLSPQGQGTAYLAAIGLVGAAAGGVAPIAAGALAEFFQAAELAAKLRWTGPGSTGEFALVTFAHWEFLFALSAACGLYVMHALSRIDEGGQVSERLVMQEFALEAWRSLASVSSVGGWLGSLFPFERLTERRNWWRGRSPPRASPAARPSSERPLPTSRARRAGSG